MLLWLYNIFMLNPCVFITDMDLWSLRIIGTPMMPCMSWTGRSCAGSVWSSNMPGGRDETEMATVGVTGVVGAVSAVYYKIPSLPLSPGVRCRCGLHKYLFCWFIYTLIAAKVWSYRHFTSSVDFQVQWHGFTTGSLESHVNVLLGWPFVMASIAWTLH